MSDGPHKSLPMSLSWKRAAERIYNEAYSPEDGHDAHDALLAAVKEDGHQQIPESFVNKIQNALSNGQTELFCDQVVQKLEFLRAEVAGRPLAGEFLDYAVQAVVKGASGDDALLESARQVITDLAARGARQVEEHYYREFPRNGVVDVRQRTEGAIARLDIVMAARQFLGIDESERSRAPTKQTGLDDGVSL